MQVLKQTWILSLAGSLTVISFWSAIAQPTPSREVQVKAAFLYNFAQFAEWPSGRFAEPTSPIVIGIVGNDPFGPFLDQLVRGETIGQHPVEILRVTSVDQADSCHILFIDKSKSRELARILDQVKDKNILTVSDISGFAEEGGVIQLYVEDNRIRFEVNMTQYKNIKVVISSRVLRLAKLCCQ